MCGIFVAARASKANEEEYRLASEAVAHRGPDDHEFSWVGERCCFGFHRLRLVGMEHASDQPLYVRGCYLVCNGMIYNYAEIAARFGFVLSTNNDCEVIIHLYRLFGFSPEMVRMLDGSFAFALYEEATDAVWVCNDHLGIRPLYQGWGPGGERFYASEPKALAPIATDVRWFVPGKIQQIHCTGKTSVHDSWWCVEGIATNPAIHDEETVAARIGETLGAAVKKRLLGEREIGCLLSGGLDSSIVAALVAKARPGVRTFSIGLEGSPDLEFAAKVAEHIGSVHTAVVVTAQEMLEAIPTVVAAIQSFDVTTVRASVPQFLLCKYIAEHHPDIRIVFNGDCSEEIFASYAYSRFTPGPDATLLDNQRLLREVHLYDALRSDRTIAHFGMDARTPFSDRTLVEYVMSIPPSMKMFGDCARFTAEKHLLRVFAKDHLPECVAWRPKTALSDGVSVASDSWHDIIASHVASLQLEVPEDFKKRSALPTAEAFYYLTHYAETFGLKPRQLFMHENRLASSLHELVPLYWMPRFLRGASDPSARTWPGGEQKNGSGQKRQVEA